MSMEERFTQTKTQREWHTGCRLLLASVLILIANGYCHAQAFQDVSESSGLAHAPASPASHQDVPGWLSVAWVDFNSDGWVDILLHTYAGGVWNSDLYRNKGAEDPQNVTFAYSGSIEGLGAWGDFDNDGFIDMFGNGKHLIRNQAGVSFRDVSMDVDIDPGALNSLAMYTRSVAWCDFDNDGFLDLYIGGFEKPETAGSNPEPDLILMNRADADVSNPYGRRFELAWTQPYSGDFWADHGRGVTICDFDEDGDIDVYVSNYRQRPNRLWRNDGVIPLTEVALTYGVAGSQVAVAPAVAPYGHTIGSAWGDIDNDGHFDLFAGNFNHHDASRWSDDPIFYRNLGPGGSFHFENKGLCNVAWQESYASPAFGDYDNDGDLDLIFNAVYPTASGSIPNYPRLFRNDSIGSNWTFTEVTNAEGIGNLWAVYGVAWADYNNDGWLDLYCSGRVFKNSGGSNHWLKVKLSGGGPAEINRSAIGTQVRIAWQGKTLTRQVGSETGESNQNDMTMHFGLGSSADPVDLEIRWPNGMVQNVTNVAVDQLVEIELLVEGDLNQDYKVDHSDLAVIAEQWLGCSDPINPDCTY